MFKLTLRLILSLFVARSVFCLKCHQTDSWKCRSRRITWFTFYCLNFYGDDEECESPKVCLKGFVRSPQLSGHKGELKGCGLTEDCVKLLHDLFDQYTRMTSIISNLTVDGCTSCNGSDYCNESDKDWKIPNIKSLKGPKKNSTTAPSAAPKKKSGGSRSHFGITTIHQMSIFLHILFLMLSYF